MVPRAWYTSWTMFSSFMLHNDVLHGHMNHYSLLHLDKHAVALTHECIWVGVCNLLASYVLLLIAKWTKVRSSRAAIFFIVILYHGHFLRFQINDYLFFSTPYAAHMNCLNTWIHLNECLRITTILLFLNCELLNECRPFQSILESIATILYSDTLS